MRYLRLVIPAALAIALLSGSALARSEAAPKAPQDLKPFLLRADEPKTHEFTRTPSFSWKPVRGATRYEFQLAKSSSFSDGSILWSSKFVKAPAVAVPIALPWMTGNPYAAYARARAITGSGVTPWSQPFGFNIRWSQVPQKLSDYPGLSRWSPVEGATAYDVWFTRIGQAGWSKTVRTRTNAVDHREAYAFHDDASWTGEVRFRVRAVRIIYGEIPTGLPAVSYGPWSKEFVSTNQAQSGSLRAVAAVTNGAVSRPGNARAHELTPAFSFKGRIETTPGATTGAGLYRVYIATDKDCVNVVFRGPAVGSPAYAPRLTGTLQLPASETDLDKAKAQILPDGSEGETYGADNLRFTSSEAPADDATAGGGTDAGADSGSGDAPADDTSATPLVNGAKVDLWESGWPNGRFYWTVVPVALTQKDASEGSEGSYAYRDLSTPQDQCQSGNVVPFGKQSAPVVAGVKAPFASGLSPKGTLVAGGKQALFYGSPIVAWQPVLGAEDYEIEWSRTRYPWRTAGKAKTFGTASALPLKPGTWWYRIRGMNRNLPGTAAAMGWSTPLKLVVAAPRFSVRGSR
jgi:hypothetical protein